MSADGDPESIGAMETITATETTFAILEVLVDHTGQSGVTEIAKAAGTTKGTAYKHLTTLAALGFVDRTEGRYRPTARWLDFGRHATRYLDAYPRLCEHVDQLAGMTSETAGVMLEQAGVGVDVYSAPRTADGGPYCTTRHLHASAPGKALLAEWSDDEIQAYVDAGSLPSVTENTLTAEADLRAEISRVRDRGLAFEREEQETGINAVATAVTVGSRTFALYVTGRADELSGKRFEENVPGILLSVSRDLQTDS